jgi:hypothetical protein
MWTRPCRNGDRREITFAAHRDYNFRTVRTKAELIFAELQQPGAIPALIGQSENAHLDCKEWPVGDESAAQRMIAKAACGLTNAEGGVLVIGMKASSKSKDDADVIEAEAPVSDTALVESRTQNLIGQLVEPGIIGVQAQRITTSGKAGFVLVFVPASQGLPRRSAFSKRLEVLPSNWIWNLPYGVFPDRGAIWCASPSETAALSRACRLRCRAVLARCYRTVVRSWHKERRHGDCKVP